MQEKWGMGAISSKQGARIGMPIVNSSFVTVSHSLLGHAILLVPVDTYRVVGMVFFPDFMVWPLIGLRALMSSLGQMQTSQLD